MNSEDILVKLHQIINVHILVTKNLHTSPTAILYSICTKCVERPRYVTYAVLDLWTKFNLSLGLLKIFNRAILVPLKTRFKWNSSLCLRKFSMSAVWAVHVFHCNPHDKGSERHHTLEKKSSTNLIWQAMQRAATFPELLSQIHTHLFPLSLLN